MTRRDQPVGERRPSVRNRVRAGYVPVHHGPRPRGEPQEHHGPASLVHLLGAIASVAAGGIAWTVSATVLLAVFCAIVSGYAVQTVARAGVGTLGTRSVVAVVSVGAAVAVGVAAASARNSSWATVLVALAAGAVMHVVAELLVARSR